MNHIKRIGRNAWRSPGLLIMGIAVLAFGVCVISFALGEAGAGVVAASMGLLAFGAGLAGLSWTAGGFATPNAGARCAARPRSLPVTAGTPGC